jgi:hypothetical protein
MEVKKVHPSHKMKDDDWGDDRHCLMTCEVCSYSHCSLCLEGSGMDDDELKAPCIGFDWTKGIFDGEGNIIGRRSGTGWPKKGNAT